MRCVRLKEDSDLAEWRSAARTLLAEGVAPDQVQWQVGRQADLFGADEPAATPAPAAAAPSSSRVSRDFLQLADTVLAHNDPRRHAVLYRMLWRFVHGERGLLAMATDEDVAWAGLAAQAIRRDMHKMKAFVRFREVTDADGVVFVAWFEPTHDIVERVAPFFARRFAGMRWSILTPLRSAYWDGVRLTLAPGANQGDAPAEDALEDLWRTYFASIFNPARLKVRAMKQEMPVRYWKNLPEASLIPSLTRDASARMQDMVDRSPSMPARHIPAPVRPSPSVHAEGSIAQLHEQATHCRKCPLWKPATQAVPGEGPGDARIVVVGGQADDHDDLAGRPFTGAEGELFDLVLKQANIDRGTLYLTHAVKHFKFEELGKERQAIAADAMEQAACRSWLVAELEHVQPSAIVCVGDMAARSILGSGHRTSGPRGRWMALTDGTPVLVTVAPEDILRTRSEAARTKAFKRLVDDLRLAHEVASGKAIPR